MAIDLGDAKYTVKLDDKATAKMNSITGSMKGMGKQMAKIGAIMAAVAAGVTLAFGKMLKDWAAAGDEVAKMAKRTGWSTEALSEMRHAAELSGTNIMSLEKAVKRMSSTIEDAKDGLETYTRSFDKLGISIDDIVRMNPEEQFWAIANALAELEDPTMRAALAQDFFGRAGTDMLPMLAAGAKGIAEMRQQAHELGLVFDKEAAVSAENLTDAWTNMTGAIEGVKFALVEELAPTITALINDQILPAIRDLRIFIQENEELKQTFIDLVEGVMRFAKGLAYLIVLFKRIDDAIPDELFPILDFLSGRMGVKAGEAWRGMRGIKPPAELLPGVGELYGETARITPSGGASSSLTVNIGSYLGDETSRRELMRDLEAMMRQDGRRTSFPSVNVLGYFPGSSAP